MKNRYLRDDGLCHCGKPSAGIEVCPYAEACHGIELEEGTITEKDLLCSCCEECRYQCYMDS